MSLGGDAREESLVHNLAQSISRKIDEHQNNPEAVAVLKELGREFLGGLPVVPEWSRPFAEKFRA